LWVYKITTKCQRQGRRQRQKNYFLIRHLRIWFEVAGEITHKIKTSMPPAGIEPAIPTIERPQTHGLDRAVTMTGCYKLLGFRSGAMGVYDLTGTSTGSRSFEMVSPRSPDSLGTQTRHNIKEE
jgi:hypothetical protein